jgi:HEPN domain-containing protein
MCESTHHIEGLWTQISDHIARICYVVCTSKMREGYVCSRYLFARVRSESVDLADKIIMPLYCLA